MGELMINNKIDKCEETIDIDFPQMPFIPNEDFAQKYEQNQNLKNNTHLSIDESYKDFITEIFKTKGFLIHENWEKTLNINSKIINSNKDYIICECLIDQEKKIIEKRSFPKHLFEHIEDIKKYPYVVLSIKTKSGSTRIDVIKGENLVDKRIFNLNDEWAKIDDRDFNQPLDKHIEL